MKGDDRIAFGTSWHDLCEFVLAQGHGIRKSLPCKTVSRKTISGDGLGLVLCGSVFFGSCGWAEGGLLGLTIAVSGFFTLLFSISLALGPKEVNRE